ncbi:P-loop NTPase [Candidatus Marsarchaeota archaeon]|nr:P-loop NTPase [Candidatus Marsarchaeota archaeon]
MENSNKTELPPGAHPSFMRVIQAKQQVKERLAGIKHKIGVYSAKGGVGKTTVAINIAYALSLRGFRVGLLDADIDCPNVTMFLGINDKIDPHAPLKLPVKDGVKVASTAMLVDELKKPIIWRGPIISKMISDFFLNTDWGELDYLIIDMPPGCMPADTLILMADHHQKPIEKIRHGEDVLSYRDGKLVKSRVVKVVQQGKQKVFKLKTPNRTVFASSNHPFLKYHRNLYWKPLSQLDKGDRIIVVNCIDGGKPLRLPSFEESVHNTRKPIILPSLTTPDFMQLIGHFVGDGFIRIYKTTDRIAGVRICEPEDSKFRSKYEGMYRSLFNCNIFRDGKNMFAIGSIPLARLFQYLNLHHPAMEKCVPDWVFGLPLDQRRAFVQGYAEADGHIRHREKIVTFRGGSGQFVEAKIVQDVVSLESTNKLLIKQMHALCQMSGIRSQNIRKRFKEGNFFPDGHATKPSTMYGFEYSQKFDNANFKIARVKSVEYAGYQDTYDLQLEDNHNFIANGVVVHNTSDVPLTTMQLLDLDGFVIVTTPQKIAGLNSVRSGLMAKRLGTHIIGVVENMSDGAESSNTAEVVSALKTEFLGCIKRDDIFNRLSDSGTVPVLADKRIKESFDTVVNRLLGYGLEG